MCIYLRETLGGVGDTYLQFQKVLPVNYPKIAWY